MRDDTRFSGDEIRTATYHVLNKRRLWPDWQTFETGRALITKWGEDHLTDLRKDLGNTVWRDGVRRMKMPIAGADLVRVLGTGRLLTEYALAPLGIIDRAREPVARLGALSNLIVALYDHCFDNSPDGHRVIVRSMLRVGQLPRARRFIRRFIGRADHRLMVGLVHLYYGELERLGQHDVAGRSVVRITRRAIVKMYEAEALTAPRRNPVTESVLRRKAALPFVVMGLPGWVAATASPDLFRAHLMWLYRLGVYFGRVDDVVDIESDRRTGACNGFDLWVERRRAEHSPLAAADEIASQAEHLMRRWNQMVNSCGIADDSISNALSITTCSWFGGIGWRPNPL
jgi:hypothetical protein